MKTVSSVAFVAGVACTCLAPLAASANDMIRWPASAVNTPAGPVRGAPDLQTAAISDYHEVWVRDFGKPSPTNMPLEKALGVSQADLADFDIIAFEENGGSPAAGGGWESSLWLFTDLQNAAAATFNEQTGAANSPSSGIRFRTGSISGATYSALFGTPKATSVISWVLIDVPKEIDVNSPTFSVWASGALIGEGSPDPDAIGILAH